MRTVEIQDCCGNLVALLTGVSLETALCARLWVCRGMYVLVHVFACAYTVCVQEHIIVVQSSFRFYA